MPAAGKGLTGRPFAIWTLKTTSASWIIPASMATLAANLSPTSRNRVYPALEELMRIHASRSVLVVAHHVVNRTYLAKLLGLTPGQARQVILDNCGISVVVRNGEETQVSTLNAAFHLQGVAA